jgi:hypothetical protein
MDLKTVINDYAKALREDNLTDASKLGNQLRDFAAQEGIRHERDFSTWFVRKYTELGPISEINWKNSLLRPLSILQRGGERKAGIAAAGVYIGIGAAVAACASAWALCARHHDNRIKDSRSWQDRVSHPPKDSAPNRSLS